METWRNSYRALTLTAVLDGKSARAANAVYCRMALCLFVSLALLCFWFWQTPVAEAKGPWYVTTTGSDGNTCDSPAAPCLTINGAIIKAAAGDTIYVANGEYPITETVFAKDQSLSGGWDDGFANATALSDIHIQAKCEHDCSGITVAAGVTVDLAGFIVRGGDNYYGQGGGAYVSGTLTLSDTIFTDNRASSGAGAFVAESGVLHVYNSTFYDNSYLASGGAIAVTAGGQAEIINSTIANNRYNTFDGIISVGGGGLSNAGSMSILNSTIVSNESTSSLPSNIASVKGSKTMLENTLVAYGSFDNCAGTITSLGHNLDSGHTCAFDASGDLVDTNPRIRPLGNHGGRTSTIALRPGSPAINGGDNVDCPATDQRGQPRPDHLVCDIGAYEFGSILLIQPWLSNVYLQELGYSRLNGSAEFSIPGGALPVSSTLIYIPEDDPIIPIPDPRHSIVTFALSAHTDGVNSEEKPITQFNQLMTFAIDYDQAQLKAQDLDESTLSLFFFDEKLKAWQPLKTNIDVQKHQATAAADYIGEYILAGMVMIHPTHHSWYVTTTGSDSNSCDHPSAPCLTINGAIAKAAHGETIYVATGEYPISTTNFLKDQVLSGGWDSSFSAITGLSAIHASCGVNCHALTVNAGIYIDLAGFIVRGGDNYYGEGGGAYIAGTLTISEVVFTENRASVGAGAYVADSGVFNVYNSTFHDNTYEASGGAIAVAAEGEAQIVNSTLSSNHYDTFDGIISVGGGALSNAGTVMVLNSTIVSNTATSSLPSNIATVTGSTTQLKNTLVAFGNTDNCGGTIESLGHNLESGHTCSFSALGDLVDTNPRIRPLANNGGRTPTHALRPGSPAINHGDNADCPSVDQRGVARPDHLICDIGAFEYSWTIIEYPWLSTVVLQELGFLPVIGETPILSITIPGGALPLNSSLLYIPEDEPSVQLPTPQQDFAGFALSAHTGGANATASAGGVGDIDASQPITQLAHPMTLTINYNDAQVTALKLQEKTLQWFFYDEKSKAWQALATDLDTAKNSATTTTNRITEFVLAGEGISQPAQEKLFLPFTQR